MSDGGFLYLKHLTNLHFDSFLLRVAGSLSVPLQATSGTHSEGHGSVSSPYFRANGLYFGQQLIQLAPSPGWNSKLLEYFRSTLLEGQIS